MGKAYDPYENVVSVMEKAMEVGHINKQMFEIIKNPQRETKVYLPVEMDDGSVKVYIERPKHLGFDTATCWLPSYRWEDISGFSQDEISYLKEFIESVLYFSKLIVY